jgi:RNA exonuclease 4
MNLPEGSSGGGNPADLITPKKRTRRRRNQYRSKKAQVEPMLTESTIKKIPITPKKHHDAPMTKSDLYFALDCEMVGVGPEGLDSAVARVTIVNWENRIVLDTHVQVPVQVTDYRTHVSGVLPHHLVHARSFDKVREQVETILRGKILIGHALENDLCALGLTHPWCDVRDTALYAPYMQLDVRLGMARPRKLRDLCWERLGRCIQMDGNPHSPIEDAIAALDLYKAVRKDWEAYLQQKQHEPSQHSPVFAGQPQQQQFSPYSPQQLPATASTYITPQQAATQQQQNSSNSWFWSRRPKSPSRSGRASPVPEEPSMEEVDASPPSSPSQSKPAWSFFHRRSRFSGIQPSPTTETEVSSDNSWAPDYTYLQETNWSQSFQIQDQGERRARLGSEDGHWSQNQRQEDPWQRQLTQENPWRPRTGTEESWQRQRRADTDESWTSEWGVEDSYASYSSFPVADWSAVAGYSSIHEPYATRESRRNGRQ